MKSSTEKYMSMEFKKFHSKILKHMKTFGVTIDHILVHFIGSKPWFYVSFRIPLQLIQYWISRLRGDAINDSTYKLYLLFLASPCLCKCKQIKLTLMYRPLCLKQIHVCELHQTRVVNKKPEIAEDISNMMRPARPLSQTDTKAVL